MPGTRPPRFPAIVADAEQAELDLGRWPSRLVQAVRTLGFSSPEEARIRAIRTPADGDAFGNAAIARDGELVGYHVTDDPDGLVAFLESGGDVLGGRGRDKFGDLGPGFYVSAIPQIWVSRSTGKWDFLKTLDADQRRALADAIRADSRLTDPGYLASDERARALRDLETFETNGDWYIVYLAGQPYNIPFWKRDFLEPLGIGVGRGPSVVEVHFVGRYVELDGGLVDYGLPDALRGAGYQGAFTRDGFSSISQLVIWDSSAIRSAAPAGLDLGAQLSDFKPRYVRSPPADAPTVEPWQMTRDEYLAAINRKGKWFSTDQIKTHAIEPNEAAGEVKGFLAHPTRAEYSTLLFTRQHGDRTIEYRQSSEPQRYVKWDESHPNADSLGMVRDPATGLAVMLSDEEMAARNLPPTNQTIVAFDGDQPVGFAADEWGAVLVDVAREYQGLGIGKVLSRAYRAIHPWKDSGGQTDAGRAMSLANHRDMVREALERGEVVPERVLAEYPDLGQQKITAGDVVPLTRFRQKQRERDWPVLYTPDLFKSDAVEVAGTLDPALIALVQSGRAELVQPPDGLGILTQVSYRFRDGVREVFISPPSPISGPGDLYTVHFVDRDPNDPDRPVGVGPYVPNDSYRRKTPSAEEAVRIFERWTAQDRGEGAGFDPRGQAIPAVLYHGTSHAVAAAILLDGLKAGSSLAQRPETSERFGPVVLAVDVTGMNVAAWDAWAGEERPDADIVLDADPDGDGYAEANVPIPPERITVHTQSGPQGDDYYVPTTHRSSLPQEAASGTVGAETDDEINVQSIQRGWWEATSPDGSRLVFGIDGAANADNKLGDACILYFGQGDPERDGDDDYPNDEDDDGGGDDDEVAGFVEETGLVGYFGSLDTGQAGQGWGRKLTERALEILRSNGITVVYVPAEPQSINFWAHMGFEDLGGEACHAMRMELEPAGAEVGKITTAAVITSADEGYLRPDGSFVPVTARGGHDRLADRVLRQEYAEWDWRNEPELARRGYNTMPMWALLFQGWVRVGRVNDPNAVGYQTWRFDPSMKGSIEGHATQKGATAVVLDQLVDGKWQKIPVEDLFDADSSRIMAARPRPPEFPTYRYRDLNRETSRGPGKSSVVRPMNHTLWPAFRDTATGKVYPSTYQDGRPAGIHLLEGLPDEVVLAREPDGYVTDAVPTLESGFVDADGAWLTREEAYERVQRTAQRRRTIPPGEPREVYDELRRVWKELGEPTSIPSEDAEPSISGYGWTTSWIISWWKLEEELRSGDPARVAEAVAWMRDDIERLRRVGPRLRESMDKDRQEREYESRGYEFPNSWGVSDRDLAKARRGKVWLYHGTSTALLPGILARGLRPGQEVGIFSDSADDRRGTRSDAVYLTPNVGGFTEGGSAWWYARQAVGNVGGQPTVLRVLVDGGRLRRDDDPYSDSAARYQFSVDYVSPDEILEVDGVPVEQWKAQHAGDIGLEAAAPTVELYHGTRAENLEGILAGGLSYPFLTDDADAALRWAKSYANPGEDVVVLSVEVDPDRLVPDTNDAQHLWEEIWGDREWEDVRGLLSEEGEEMLRLSRSNGVDWRDSEGHDTGSLSVIYIGVVPPTQIQVLGDQPDPAENDEPGDEGDFDLEAAGAPGRYGWLDPDGTFREIPFHLTHQRSADEIVRKEFGRAIRNGDGFNILIDHGWTRVAFDGPQHLFTVSDFGRHRDAIESYLVALGAAESDPVWIEKWGTEDNWSGTVGEFFNTGSRNLRASAIPVTGEPFTFHYVRNTEKAPNMGARYGQDVEPAGRYVTPTTAEEATAFVDSLRRGPQPALADRYELGEITFQNPLVLDWGSGGYGDEDSWKRVLSARYRGLTGARLSRAILADGHDGIVTVKDGELSECVILGASRRAGGRHAAIDSTTSVVSDRDGYKTLREVWHGSMPGDDEMVWNFIEGQQDFDHQPFRIVTFDPVAWLDRVGNDGLTPRQRFEDRGEPWQYELVDRYRDAPEPDSYAVVKGDFLIDGHHRAYALALDGVHEMRAVDIDQPLDLAGADLGVEAASVEWPPEAEWELDPEHYSYAWADVPLRNVYVISPERNTMHEDVVLDNIERIRQGEPIVNVIGHVSSHKPYGRQPPQPGDYWIPLGTPDDVGPYGFVADGMHRCEAAKRLGIPFIRIQQQLSKSWEVDDLNHGDDGVEVDAAAASNLSFEVNRRSSGRWARADTVQVTVYGRLDATDGGATDQTERPVPRTVFAGQVTALEVGGFAGAREDVAALEAQGFKASAYWFVSNAWLDESFRGQGVGRAMYDRLIEEIGKVMKGAPFFFGSQQAALGTGTTRAAERVWESLARQFPSSGQAIYVNPATATAPAAIEAAREDVIHGRHQVSVGPGTLLINVGSPGSRSPLVTIRKAKGVYFLALHRESQRPGQVDEQTAHDAALANGATEEDWRKAFPQSELPMDTLPPNRRRAAMSDLEVAQELVFADCDRFIEWAGLPPRIATRIRSGDLDGVDPRLVMKWSMYEGGVRMGKRTSHAAARDDAVTWTEPEEPEQETFEQHIERLRQGRRQAYQDFVALFQPNLEFHSLRTSTESPEWPHWAFVARETTPNAGEWRTQTFGREGFHGHRSGFATLEAARDALFDELWRAGADRVVPDPGALSRVTGTEVWEQGMERAREVQRWVEQRVPLKTARRRAVVANPAQAASLVLAVGSAA